MVTGSAEADERISVPYLASASQNDIGVEQDSAATAYTTSNARSPLAHVVRTTKETALIFQSNPSCRLAILAGRGKVNVMRDNPCAGPVRG